jgi:probable phosphoglycerate mutase
VTTTVFFVRHGSHDYLGKVLCGRGKPVSLNDDGRREADALAGRLAGERLEAVYASPLARTVETAAPIASRCGLEVRRCEALIEIDFGAWSGRPFAALAGDPAWDLWNDAREAARPPGGETMQEVEARVAGFLREAVGRHPGGRIAAVAHGDVIKAGVGHALGLPINHQHRFEISPGSVSVICAGGWGMKVHSINEAPR